MKTRLFMSHLFSNPCFYTDRDRSLLHHAFCFLMGSKSVFSIKNADTSEQKSKFLKNFQLTLPNRVTSHERRFFPCLLPSFLELAPQRRGNPAWLPEFTFDIRYSLPVIPAEAGYVFSLGYFGWHGHLGRVFTD